MICTLELQKTQSKGDITTDVLLQCNWTKTDSTHVLMYQVIHKINYHPYYYSENKNDFSIMTTILYTVIKIISTSELKIKEYDQWKLSKFIINIITIMITNKLNIAVNSHKMLSHCNHTQITQRINIRYIK